jgi:hypothetical protein
MAICAYCKTQETETFENGVPICLACSTDKAAHVNRKLPADTRATNARTTELPEDLKRSG